MKRALGLLLVVALGICTMGMGTTGRGSGKIPVPIKDFSAVIVDRQNVSTPVTQITFNGQTSLEGKRGEGSLTISFDRIRAVSFSAAGPGQRRAVVTLKEAKESVELMVDGQLKVTGQSRYGAFEITANNIQRIDFRGAP